MLGAADRVEILSKGRRAIKFKFSSLLSRWHANRLICINPTMFCINVSVAKQYSMRPPKCFMKCPSSKADVIIVDRGLSIIYNCHLHAAIRASKNLGDQPNLYVLTLAFSARFTNCPNLLRLPLLPLSRRVQCEVSVMIERSPQDADLTLPLHNILL